VPDSGTSLADFKAESMAAGQPSGVGAFSNAIPVSNSAPAMFFQMRVGNSFGVVNQGRPSGVLFADRECLEYTATSFHHAQL
jgi:hypothetical protein